MVINGRDDLPRRTLRKNISGLDIEEQNVVQLKRPNLISSWASTHCAFKI